MSRSGVINRKVLEKQLVDKQLVLNYDAIQNLVLNSFLNSDTEPFVSATASDVAIPVTILGDVYYIKLSTTP